MFKDTIFVFGAYGLWPMLEYELDIIQRLLDQNYQVYYFTCNGSRAYCSALRPNTSPNSLSRYIQCSRCQSRVSKGLSWLNFATNQFITVAFESKLISTSNQINNLIDDVKAAFNESSASDVVNAVESYIPNLHSSAIASLISDHKCPNLNILDYKDEYINILRTVAANYHAYYYYFNLLKPVKVYVFNGRGIYQPFIDLSIDLGVSFFVYEYPETSFENYWLIQNASFFEVGKLSQFINEFGMKNQALVDQYSIRAVAWLKNRQQYNLESYQGALLNNKLKHMKNGQLPNELPIDRPVIGYFTSSENEYANNQDYIQSKLLSQPDLIVHLAKSFPDSTLVVRFHPNSSQYDVEAILKPLSRHSFKNLFLYPPDSPVSSHALIDKASCVVTYGSSIGYEAAFKSKCVVTIGYSFYNSFDCHRAPRNLEELDALINSALSPQQSLFPSSADRVKESIRYVKSYMAFGTRPKYMRRNSYYGGFMIRSGSSTVVNASIFWLVVDRVYSRINRIFHLFSK
jgi:hypothetical protein